MHDNTEWKLHPVLFQKICKVYGTPEIDLFASRLNKQLEKYCSWKPDPGAYAIDSLSENWEKWFFYAFPPFNMIGKVLKKVESEKASGLIVVPYWPTQHWFSKFTQMCQFVPSILFSRDAVPTVDHPWRPTSQLPKTRWLVGWISGRPSETWGSQMRQRPSSSHPGDHRHTDNTLQHSRNGIVIVIRGEKTLCVQI